MNLNMSLAITISCQLGDQDVNDLFFDGAFLKLKRFLFIHSDRSMHHPARKIIAEFVPADVAPIVAEFATPLFNPATFVAALVYELFPSVVADIIGQYARSTDDEIVDLIPWECDDIRANMNAGSKLVEMKCNLIKKQPEEDGHCMMYLSFIDDGNRRDELKYHSYAASVSYESIDSKPFEWPLDRWPIPKLDLYADIIADSTSSYKASYFLPFIHIFHARLKNATMHG